VKNIQECPNQGVKKFRWQPNSEFKYCAQMYIYGFELKNVCRVARLTRKKRKNFQGNMLVVCIALRAKKYPIQL
jgi:hypothetical protein